jgi:hypothetical protein
VSHDLNLALFSAVLLAYSIVAGRQRGRPFDGPLLFIAIGVLLGPHALAWLQPDIGASSFRLLVEITLAPTAAALGKPVIPPQPPLQW